MEEAYSFGVWLRRRRKTLDLTQEDLARQVGISVTTVRKLEADERRPSRQVAQLLAEALQISPKDTEQFIKVARAETRIDYLNIPDPVLESLPAHYTQVLSVAARPDAISSGVPERSLPVPSTPLIGRERELEQITQMLRNENCRLLTITGPGGIGKTRLALAAAHTIQSHYENRVFFVSLAPVNPGESIFPVIANSIGLTIFGNHSIERQIASFINEKRMLMVLDNFEHVLDNALLLDEVLRYTRNLNVLATSRERLNLQPEWVFELQGLPYPVDDPTNHYEDYSAFQLFLQTAQRSRPGIDLSGGERLAAGRICSLLDGNPLAIELAAGWVRALSCEEIYHEIRRNLDFLSTRGRDIPERQQSLRATFDYSWSLLPDEEQRALRKLSIFRGGFRRSAAEQIAMVELPVLLSLVEKSLIRRVDTGWFTMHELVRQYAFSHFQALTHEHIQIYDRHCHYYAELCNHWETDLRSERQVQVLHEITVEYENVRLAWDWGVSLLRMDDIQKMTPTMWLYHEIRGFFQEGMALFEQASEQLVGATAKEECLQELPARLLGDGLARQAWFLGRLGKMDQAIPMLERAICLLEANHALKQLAEAHFFLGFLLYRNSQFDQSTSITQTGLQIYQQLDDSEGISRCLTLLGTNFLACQDLERAESYIQQSINSLSPGRNPVVRIENLLGLTAIAIQKNDVDRGASLVEESLKLAIEYENRMLQARSLRLLGMIRMQQGNYIEADRLLENCIEILQMTGDPALQAFAWIARSQIALQQESVPVAFEHANRAAQLSRDFEHHLLYMDLGHMMAKLYIQQADYSSALDWLLLAEQAIIIGAQAPMDLSEEWKTIRQHYPEGEIEDRKERFLTIPLLKHIHRLVEVNDR